MTTIKHLTFTLLFINSWSLFAQKSKATEPDFYYSVESNIKNTGYFSLQIDPIAAGIIGNHVISGIGAQGRISNLFEKFSLDLGYNFNYFDYSIDQNKIGYESFDIDQKSSSNLEASIGFTFMQERKNEQVVVQLKKTSLVETVSFLPADVVKSYIIRAGYMNYGMFLRGEATADDEANGFFYAADHYNIFQNVNVISLGIVRKKSIDTKYKTDKYGDKRENRDHEIYFDVLFNIGNEFPQINRLMYNDPTYPNEPSDKLVVPYNEQNAFREQFVKLPVGIKVGARLNSLTKWGFNGKLEAGFYPGSYSSLVSAFGIKFGIGFRFLNKFN